MTGSRCKVPYKDQRHSQMQLCTSGGGGALGTDQLRGNKGQKSCFKQSRSLLLFLTDRLEQNQQSLTGVPIPPFYTVVCSNSLGCRLLRHMIRSSDCL